MRAFWLTWMWLARAMMMFCVGLATGALAYGHTGNLIVALVSLPVNAVTAELARRRAAA